MSIIIKSVIQQQDIVFFIETRLIDPSHAFVFAGTHDDRLLFDFYNGVEIETLIVPKPEYKKGWYCFINNKEELLVNIPQQSIRGIRCTKHFKKKAEAV